MRANCGQQADADGEDDHVDLQCSRMPSRGSSAPITPSTSSAIRMAGKVSCTSATRISSASTPAADVAGDQPERDADTTANSTDAGADHQADARAVHDRGQHVAPLVVGAERIGPVGVDSGSRRLEAVEQAQAREIDRIVRRDPGRETGAEQKQIRLTTAETIATGEWRKLYNRSLSRQDPRRGAAMPLIAPRPPRPIRSADRPRNTADRRSG